MAGVQRITVRNTVKDGRAEYVALRDALGLSLADPVSTVLRAALLAVRQRDMLIPLAARSALTDEED